MGYSSVHDFSDSRVPSLFVISTVAVFSLALFATIADVPLLAVAAIVVATTIFFGPTVALGGVIALLMHDLFRGAVGPWTLTLCWWVLTFTLGFLLLGRDRNLAPVDPKRTVIATLLLFIAGTWATASAAWLGLVLRAEPVFVAMMSFGRGVVIVSLLVLPGLWVLADRPFSTPNAEKPARWLRSDGGQIVDGNHAISNGNGLRPRRTLLLLTMAVTGSMWLLGAAAIDLLSHDLGLFATEETLRRFGTSMLGESIIGSLGVRGLLLVYQYGQVGILLSGPMGLVAATVLLWRYHALPTPP